MILAAGRGTRLKSTQSKVLHPIGGLPLVGHCLRLAQQVGIPRTTLVISPDLEHSVSSLKEQTGAPFSYIVQDPPGGTGEAAQIALKGAPEKAQWILVLYGDTPLVPPAVLRALLAKAQENPKTGVCVLAMRLQEPAGYAHLVETPDGKSLSAIIEEKEASPEAHRLPLCNAGLLLYHEVASSLVPRMRPRGRQESFLTDIVSLAHAEGWINSYVEGPAEGLRGANTRADLAALERTFQERARAEAMEAGVTLVDPASVFFSYDTQLAPDVTVLPHVFFKKGVQVGSGSRIGPFCVLEGVSVGSDALIGPFAHLRPGARLEDRVRVGNFVEIKNAHVKEGAKINHLSYIGDASLGKACNIGAGTITCNYDGLRKHKTIIGDKAFIGSNTALVAPVEVAKEAVIGAGSTITRDIPEGVLALTRADLTIVSEYKRKKSCAES